MRTHLIAALSLFITVTANVAQAGPPVSSPAPTQVATADVNRLYQQAATAEQARNQALATLAQYKAAVIAQRTRELTDPNSEALRSPSAWVALTAPGTGGSLTGRDQYRIDITDGSGQAPSPDVMAALQGEIVKELDALGNELTSCMPNGWPVVTTSFAYRGGRMTAAPEVSELAPLDASSVRMANCVLAGINAHRWQNLGDYDVNIIWRNIGGP